jgi:hypothetical protein
MDLRTIAAVILSCAIAGLNSVAAQTQQQQDRLNAFGKFAVTSALCSRIGMQVDDDIDVKAEAALALETADWQVDPAVVKRLKNEAAGRQGAILRADLGGAAEAAKTEKQLRGLSDIILGYGRTCLEATHDPVFAKLIVAPSGYDLQKSVTAFADQMLEGGGLASWQTPEIQARGDLMTLAGICRQRIGATRSDALINEFGQSADPRARDYYNKAFDRGLEDPDKTWTLAGCNRAIGRLRAKATSRKTAGNQ